MGRYGVAAQRLAAPQRPGPPHWLHDAGAFRVCRASSRRRHPPIPSPPLPPLQAALKAGRRVDCVVSESRYYDCGTRSEYLQLASELWHQIESRQ